MAKQRIRIHAADPDLWTQLLNAAEQLEWYGLADTSYAHVENMDQLDDGSLWVSVHSSSNVRMTMRVVEKTLRKARIIDRLEITVED